MTYVRGFRFPAPPATLGPSLPGLMGCAHFVSLRSLIALYPSGKLTLDRVSVTANIRLRRFCYEKHYH
jgi:hypothetical protein